MTTTEYLQREIRRTELSIRRAERKPNTPAEELRGLHEKLEHLKEALEAVEEHWKRVHEQRGWTAGEPLMREQPADVRPAVRGRWEWMGPCRDNGGRLWATCTACGLRQRLGDFTMFCPNCGADMRG